MDYDEIVKPKKTLRRREEEAEGDGDGGTTAAAVKKTPPPKPAAEAAPAAPAPRFTTGPRTVTPEEQARRIEEFRKLQTRQRKAVVI